MAQTVVTELRIDADTSGADRFQGAMEKSGASASTVALQVAGISFAVAAALTGLRSFVDYVGGVNKQLIDLDRNAVAAGMSTREFQQSLFAARAAGLTEKDFVAGLDKITQDLVQASRGVTDFGKLFDANGLSIRDATGKLKDAKVAVTDIMGLMQNATPQVQQGISRIVGVSREWIPLLQEGETQFEKHKQLAEDLGLIIDDATVKKAREFDQQWRVAVASWDIQFKKSLTELLPMMVQLAGYAIWILDAVGKVSGSLSRSFSDPEAMNSADLTKTLDRVIELNDKFVALGENASKFQSLHLEQGLGGAHFKGEMSQKAIDDYQDHLQDLLDAKTEISGPTHVTVPGRATVLPRRGLLRSS